MTALTEVFVYESPDLPGQWVARDAVTDVVSQGNSRPHALAMLAEALALHAGEALPTDLQEKELRCPSEETLLLHNYVDMLVADYRSGNNDAHPGRYRWGAKDEQKPGQLHRGK